MFALGYFTLFLVPFVARYLVLARLSWPPVTKQSVLLVIFGADGLLLVRITQDAVGWAAAISLFLIAFCSFAWVVLVGITVLSRKEQRHVTESWK